ncbi:flagellar biosynthetic protein FliR [Phaeovibrio sulfidiphilus]|uniref:Flagellar biosynthetic protein FliR n=1 Tax=Phaeovibrio sulfidiphilus TaxID=1220600 RepID=A0A8J6YWP6_9PROT|nr:flagellar biosynthetic protein FliR [Phaeovibrio sulfidiphilus]
MLEHLLTLNVFHFALVLTRISAAMMLLPGFSAEYVSTQIRVFLSLALALVCTPAVSAGLPEVPSTALMVGLLVGMEAIVGLFLGVYGRFLLVVLSFMGHVVGYSSGLMMAQSFDPVTYQQGSLITRYFNQVLVVLMFVTGIHQIMVLGVLNSYTTFPAGAVPDTADTARLFTSLLLSGFRVGLQLASPFMVYAILFQATLGIMARLMPRLNILFIALPAQIMLAFAILITAGAFILRSMIDYLERGFGYLAMP